MRDWKSWKESVQALPDADIAGMFVGVDTLIELVDELSDITQALIRVARTGDICEFCANRPDASRCMINDMTCPDCPNNCACKDCDGFAGFLWKKPEPALEVVVTDEPPSDSDSAWWTIALLADGTVTPVQIGERPGLDQLQAMVDGNIETMEFRVPGTGRRFVAVFNEEGKLKNLPANELATEALAPLGDYLTGTVLVLKIEGEDIVGLTTSEATGLMGLFGEEWEGENHA